MSYAIIDVELTEPLPAITLDADQDGAYFLVRAHGRPVHCALHPLPPGMRLTPTELDRLLGRPVAQALLEDTLRVELARPLERLPVSLTVAICTRGRPALLAGCLHSLLDLRSGGRADTPRFELVVVDNDPPDDATRRVVAAMAGVRYVHEPIPGLDVARNRALAAATGAWIAFLDDDVTVDREWLAGLEEALAEHPDAASVTGLVAPAELATPAQITFERRGGFGRGCRKRRFTGPAGPDNPLYPLGAGTFGAGCNMVLRVDAVRALGGFDEALDTGPPLPGGGDLDIWFRLANAGHALVYEPRMLVFHRHRADRAGLRRQYWSWGEGFMAYLTKTARAVPAERSKAVRLAAWWLRYQARAVAGGLRPAAALPGDLALAELTGGLVGLAGAYGRSRRRMARVRGTFD